MGTPKIQYNCSTCSLEVSANSDFSDCKFWITGRKGGQGVKPTYRHTVLYIILSILRKQFFALIVPRWDSVSKHY